MEDSAAPGATLQDEIESLHSSIRRQFPRVERVAAAIYEPATDLVKTFAHSTDGRSPLEHYEARLSDTPSLQALAQSRVDRVIDDLRTMAGSPHEHTQRLLEKGYRSSYTTPLFEGDRLFGFLFFDAREPGYFRPMIVEQLSVFARVLALKVAHVVAEAHLLGSALRLATRLTHYRDPETHGHLSRMAHYARMIARAIAPFHGLTDEFVESVLRYAPMHDIGKIAVPDRILLKHGPLTLAEFEVMKTHVTKGAEIVDGILSELDMGTIPHLDVLRNVVLCHHEAVDGSGYPGGRRGPEIPIEARIVTVADVFDALTSERPYKEAWPVDDALRYLSERAGLHFDPDCVNALQAHAEEAALLMAQFTDEAGATQSREGYSLEL